MVALNAAFGHRQDGLVVLTLVFVGTKLALIPSATGMMYRPANRGYFR